jgi:hypothetical protein
MDSPNYHYYYDDHDYPYLEHEQGGGWLALLLVGFEGLPEHVTPPASSRGGLG